MSAVVRSPYETLRDEADAIGQHARAAAEFASPIDRVSAHLLAMCAERADDVVRSMRRRLRELDKASEGNRDG